MYSVFKTLFNNLLKKIDLKIIRISTQFNTKQQSDFLFNLNRELLKILPQNDLVPEIVIFSMDRALQLHALLGSILDNVSNTSTIHVLYRASTAEHAKAFEEVFLEFDKLNIYPITQKSKQSFREQLIRILESIESEKMFFLVDDDLFIEKLDLKDLTQVYSPTTIFSLRMGENLEESYTTHRKQPKPEFKLINSNQSSQDDQISWSWNNSVLDWAYPLSVDGHLFSSKEILAMSRCIDFDSPNTYENNLQTFLPFFLNRSGLCFRKSRLVNIPCNKVQDYNNNRHGQIHQNDLLEKWQKGEVIDFKKLYKTNNISAHQELNLNFKSRLL